MNAAWRIGQFRKAPLHPHLAKIGVRNRHDRLARLKVRIGQHVGRAVNPPGGDRVRDHQRLDLVDAQGARPGIDDPVKLVLVLTARGVGGIARVGGQFRPAHGLRQPREDGVTVGADHVFAVGAGIDIRRRQPRQDRARTLPDDAHRIVFHHQAFHHLQHRFVKRRVDHLPFAGFLTHAQRGQRAHAGIACGQRIADGDAHARGRPVRIAHDSAPAAHRFGHSAKPRTRRIGAGLAIA